MKGSVTIALILAVAISVKAQSPVEFSYVKKGQHPYSYGVIEFDDRSYRVAKTSDNIYKGLTILSMNGRSVHSELLVKFGKRNMYISVELVDDTFYSERRARYYVRRLTEGELR